MWIKTTGEINARTHDGRDFTADGGSVVEIDDEDAGMVGLAKVLILSGRAEHHGDVGTVDEEPAPVEVGGEQIGDQVYTEATDDELDDDALDDDGEDG